ncbi:hypothetical protein EV190_10115 [Actinorugispora endophytica]|uniref:Multidrug resistance protein MdtA-like C-terminal permuted SH3 domain-containing protein n=1 Tax=Actinorugispora endophytica TaxID=1605990 RepID=A0A4R6V697_9ACTN|nr:efflux RND transporter periplasmic adaptor subunit [Actinorugispora endophytica]TDQ54702.1 hypothetical protein EV190_10115 [Actinorugispora endophytica]
MKKWIIVGAVLAVLLCTAGAGGYLLLSSGSEAGEDFTAPGTGLVAESEPVEVRHGEISSRVVLSATVTAAPGKAVESKRSGTVARVWLSDGQSVEEGAPVVTLTVADEVPAAAGAGDDGEAAAPATTEVVVRAPATGTVAGLGDLAVGDPVEAGPIAEVVKDEFRAVARIEPNEVYRFYEDPHEIMLKIDRGPAPEPCEFMSLGTGETSGADGSDSAAEDAPGAGGAADGADGASIELVCRIPDSLKVFPGVQGQLSIVTGRARNALIVPVTAVRGSVDEGEVLVVGEDGSEEVREVGLGISDGENVEVVRGLSIGDRVMDPVPLSEEFDVPSAPPGGDEVIDGTMSGGW